MTATDPDSSPDQAATPRPFIFDVAEIEGHTNEEMMHEMPEAEFFYELLGRDLLTKVLVQTEQLCVYHETAKPGEQVKPHRHGTYQVNYVLQGELLFGNQTRGPRHGLLLTRRVVLVARRRRRCRVDRDPLRSRRHLHRPSRRPVRRRQLSPRCMKVLVVGGSQFNGFALVQELVRRGHDVTVVNRGRTDAPFPDSVRRLTADRTDRERMAEVLGSEEYDCVHDMSAYHPEDVELMIDLLRGRVGHYVFVSSTVIYPRSTLLPITETSAVDRSEHQIEYGLHKLLCEDRLLEAFASSGFPATTVALSMVMGPRNIVPDREQRMFVRLLRGRPVLILGRGTALSQIGDVDDQAEALCEVMGKSVTFGQRYNLTGGQYFSDEGYVEVFADVVGADAHKVFVPTDVVDDGVGRSPRARSRPPHRRAHRHPHDAGGAAHAGDGDPPALPARQRDPEARAAPPSLGRQRALRHRQVGARRRVAPAPQPPRRRSRAPTSGSRARASPIGSPSTSRSRTSSSSTARSDMTEGQIEINGGNVVYEFVGPDDGEVVVITPGGRFSKDYGGVHELADALAAGGKRVLLWDRPNCGRSDIQVYGRSESHMRAETLGLLVQELGIERVVATGGSGGARDMICFTIMWPDLVRKLAVWSIVGGTFSTMLLATAYVLDELRTVRSAGIEGVIEMDDSPFSWAAMIRQNPANRDRLLALGSDGFEQAMDRWLDAFVPKPNEAIPGVPDWEFATITCPTLGDPRRRARLRPPQAHQPRGAHADQGFSHHRTAVARGRLERAVEATNEGRGSLFDPWVLAAPTLLEFIDEP